MKYQHIVSYVRSQLWAIDPSKLHDLLAVLAHRASGKAFTKAEIEARIGDGGAGPSVTQGNGVAVIPIRGVIAHRMGSMDDTSGGTSCERISAMLAQVSSDASIGTVVFDIDSPGGTVTGVSELAGKMYETRGRGTQRFIAQVNGLAASAAYWLAAQCDEIVSIPSGTAGSIGVFTAHEDLSAALEKEGVKVTLISAGKYKTAGNPLEPLSDEERAVLQARVDAAYGQFVADVARGRGVTPAAVRGGYGEGRALTAPDALKAGLIDRISTMDQTLGRLLGRTPKVGGMRAELAALGVSITPELEADEPAMAAVLASVLAARAADYGMSAETLAAMLQFQRDNPELAAQAIEDEHQKRLRTSEAYRRLL